MKCGLWGFQRPRSALIPNGVHVAEFQPVRSGAAIAVSLYLGDGQLQPQERLRRAAACLHVVAAADPSIHLVLAGAGKGLTAYTALVGEHHLQGRVHFVGIVEGVVKIQLYQHCLFFVCPSRREPFATVNLEALAAGQPIVATAVGGNLEVVQRGRKWVSRPTR